MVVYILKISKNGNYMCERIECENEHEIMIGNEKYCLKHCPDQKYETIIKRLCKYCDIKENSNHVCAECRKIKNKKEWSIVRFLRKAIDTKFEYNSNKMLQGCTKKTPDIYFELPTHCIIVEIDEHQHRNYNDSCECSRINEIVNGIGGKPLVIIRFNPDIIRNKGKQLNTLLKDRLDLLVEVIKSELVKEYDTFMVKLIQLYYDDDYEIYQYSKEENITSLVAI